MSLIWIVNILSVFFLCVFFAGIVIPQILLIAFRRRLFDEPDEFVEWGRRALAVSRAASVKSPARKAAPKPAMEAPADLVAALKQSKAAHATFDAFPPGCRREYIEWIVEAKREETRAKRIAQTVEWAAEGKRRNWKYENC